MTKVRGRKDITKFELHEKNRILHHCDFALRKVYNLRQKPILIIDKILTESIEDILQKAIVN